MAYLHIQNLYRERDILLFRECYALEKIHGTSAHVAWRDGQVAFFSGSGKHARFVALFDAALLDKGVVRERWTDAVAKGIAQREPPVRP